MPPQKDQDTDTVNMLRKFPVQPCDCWDMRVDRPTDALIIILRICPRGEVFAPKLPTFTHVFSIFIVKNLQLATNNRFHVVLSPCACKLNSNKVYQPGMYEYVCLINCKLHPCSFHVRLHCWQWDKRMHMHTHERMHACMHRTQACTHARAHTHTHTHTALSHIMCRPTLGPNIKGQLKSTHIFTAPPVIEITSMGTLLSLCIEINKRSVLWYCWLGVKKSIRPVKIDWWGTGVVICLECGANDLHVVQLMPLPPHNLLLQ